MHMMTYSFTIRHTCEVRLGASVVQTIVGVMQEYQQRLCFKFNSTMQQLTFARVSLQHTRVRAHRRAHNTGYRHGRCQSNRDPCCCWNRGHRGRAGLRTCTHCQPHIGNTLPHTCSMVSVWFVRPSSVRVLLFGRRVVSSWACVL